MSDSFFLTVSSSLFLSRCVSRPSLVTDLSVPHSKKSSSESSPYPLLWIVYPHVPSTCAPSFLSVRSSLRCWFFLFPVRSVEGEVTTTVTPSSLSLLQLLCLRSEKVSPSSKWSTSRCTEGGASRSSWFVLWVDPGSRVRTGPDVDP